MLSVSILGIKENIEENVKKLDCLGINYFHIDIMDGLFVPNKTWDYNQIKFIKDTNTKKDVHLMVKNIKEYINKYIDLNPDIITFHYEATDRPLELINYIHNNNIKAGISIKPETKIDVLKDILKYIDVVLVMSVEPGAGGQTYIENSTNKINELKKIRDKNNYSYLIEVDGGINDKTKKYAKNADILVVGSFITKGNYEEQIMRIQG